MKKIYRFLRSILPLLLFISNSFAADEIIVKSPDGKIVFSLAVKNNELVYQVNFNNSPVIISSPLIVTLDGKKITSYAKIKDSKKYTVNETYPWLGVHSTAVNHANGMKVSIEQKDSKYTIDIRVFDNGSAFQIIIPGKDGEKRIPDEATVFTFPAGAVAWYHDLEMHYEGVHVKKDIAKVQQGEWMAPPATLKLTNGVYAAVTEANLQNYSGFALQADGKNGLVLRLAQHQPTNYPYRLRYSPEDTARLKQPAVLTGTIITPWRVIMIGKDLDAMVNNDMLHNLCDPPDKKYFPKGFQTDWIQPGRAVWKYLNGGGEGTPEVMKKFTDAAAAMGFEHNILEGFWSRWNDDQIKDLVNYSRQRNVNIWVWKHSRNLRSDTARVAFFKRLSDLGIRGVKVDFLDHEAKEVVDMYIDILREAAKNKILVDFHGANKPTGLSRTWPNEMTREGVKGMEASRLMDRATHETTIPFTRYLAGHGEYTVMIFGERKRNTTWAHQVASAAILFAPMLTYAANPDTILMNPAIEIIKSIPPVWDETIVLPPSEIGELAVYARRKNDTWWLAVMNGPEQKKIKIPLSFLKGNYKALAAKDDAVNSSAIIVDNAVFTANDVIELNLVPGGGYIARFSK